MSRDRLRQKRTPWYHVPLSRCAVTTHAGYQCSFSARYEDVGGKRIYLCKTHADMAEFPTKLITETWLYEW